MFTACSVRSGLRIGLPVRILHELNLHFPIGQWNIKTRWWAVHFWSWYFVFVWIPERTRNQTSPTSTPTDRERERDANSSWILPFLFSLFLFASPAYKPDRARSSPLFRKSPRGGIPNYRSRAHCRSLVEKGLEGKELTKKNRTGDLCVRTHACFLYSSV